MEFPKGMTKKQIELLVLILPAPRFKGLKIKDAAKELGIQAGTAYKRLGAFKKKFPDLHKKLFAGKKIVTKHRLQLEQWNRYKYKSNNFKVMGWFNRDEETDYFSWAENKGMIKEIF